jgi:hypothetical protein
MDPNSPRRFRGVNYEITLRRDVPAYSWFWIAAIFLFIPPILYSLRAFSFERARWAESDHPLVQSSSNSDDDD